MQKLSAIINAAKANEPVDAEELRYALCAMEALSTFDSLALQRLSERDLEGHINGAASQYTESFNRWKMALGKSPKEWLGWGFDPANPAYQERRRMSTRLFERFSGGGR